MEYKSLWFLLSRLTYLYINVSLSSISTYESGAYYTDSIHNIDIAKNFFVLEMNNLRNVH